MPNTSQYKGVPSQFGLNGGRYQKFSSLLIAVYLSNHSELTLYLQHVRTELNVGQRQLNRVPSPRRGTRTPLSDKSQTLYIALLSYVEQTQNCCFI